MEEFASLNRDKNNEIIDQALAIASLLNQEGISPIFLKGTAHMLDGLFQDIGERMMGDIDLLVDENDMVRAAEILNQNGYEPLIPFLLKNE